LGKHKRGKSRGKNHSTHDDLSEGYDGIVLVTKK
jgi:hypothetical protein